MEYPTHRNTLADKIISRLSKGPADSRALVEWIIKNRMGTKQAAYRAFKKLAKKEVIVKKGTLVSINTAWLARLERFLKDSKGENFSIATLLPKDISRKITKTFKNTTAMDVYLGHLFLVLAEKLENEPIFLYNPHEWFIYDRPESEKNLFLWIAEKKKHFYLTIGTDTPLAREFKRKEQNKYVQIAIDEKFAVPKNEYVVVVGDYVIHAAYDKDVSAKIDSLFRRAKEFGEAEKEELEDILVSHKKSKVTIQENKSLADRWKKRLGKNFFLK